jgi:hypothetical protein
MLNGVKIILERMKTNPEEFSTNNLMAGKSKWGRLLAKYQDIISPEENALIREGLRSIEGDSFDKEVLEMLMGEPPEQFKINMKDRYATASGWTDPRGTFGSAEVKGGGQKVEY